jgi:long-chain acyl-CoA synthetase
MSTPSTIPELVEDSARKFGAKVAYQMKVGSSYQRLTFSELAQRSREFAAGLLTMGMRKGDAVAIISENSLDWIVGYYGLSMAGGVGVPLYSELNSPEIEDLVRRSDARYVIASSAVLGRLPDRLPGVRAGIVAGGNVERGTASLADSIVRFDAVAATATDESRRMLQSTHVSNGDLASIVFTSGTMGGAKGVMLTHGNFTADVESVRRGLPIGSGDRMLTVLPFHHALPFTVGVLTFTSLGVETTLENDLARLRDRMQETKPTLFGGVPALFKLMYRAITRQLEAEGKLGQFQRAVQIVDRVKRVTGLNIGPLVFRPLHRRLGGHLRFIVSGGAALDPEIARDYLRLGLPIVQGWGLTEAAPVVSVQRWNAAKFLFTRHYEKRAGSVGPPLPGVEVAVLDDAGGNPRISSDGEGELLVRGPNVFLSYYKEPDLTREAKVGDWFRTGDLGRIDSERSLWITGRVKSVIVLESGKKVIPDRIEDLVTPDPLIESICVVPLRVGRKTVVSAIIHPDFNGTNEACREKGLPLNEDCIRTVLKERLSQLDARLDLHERISELVVSDTPLPQTPLGKVARGRVEIPHSFDLERWERNSHEPEFAH